MTKNILDNFTSNAMRLFLFSFFVYLSEKSQTFDQFCRKESQNYPPLPSWSWGPWSIQENLKWYIKCKLWWQFSHLVGFRLSNIYQIQGPKYIHTLNSPRLQPPSLEKTFYATYAYYDGDQRTTYECIYLGKCRAFIEMRECNKNSHFVCFLKNLEFRVQYIVIK